MDTPLLHPEVQEFIHNSLDANFSKLALTKNPFPEIAWSDILTQIGSKKKAQSKLPTWYNSQNIIYPSKLSIEQTSSEVTAKYKSEIISGKTLIDLTGGFGVDAFYFAQKTNRVLHCEYKKELSVIVQHNFDELGVKNIECISADSSKVLEELNQKFDWIYIDPSRRSDAKGKVFMLKDCLPNVPENLGYYFNFANQILVKTAPILDLTAGILELTSAVKEIHIVAVHNEVKELLWVLHKGNQEPIVVKTINLQDTQTQEFEFSLHSEKSISDFGLPQKYLYEPNSAIMKSGNFDHISEKFGIQKLHQHSHLYTSDSLIPFPGRIFEINKVLDYTKSNMKVYFLNQKMNVSIRNFPEKVDEIRKKWKIKDGGSIFSFFTTDLKNNKIALLCTKIN